MAGVNDLLDRLPRSRLGRGSREVPAFRTCGIVGFYGALIATMGGGLLAGRSLLVLAALSVVCALSFFVWAYLRRWVGGAERLVLLEHVWFAEACSAGTLWALGQPVLSYLDVIAVGLTVFLAGGRTGCLLVGCCHGRPSSLGIRYGEECARDGFPRHLVGVRLFPVQAVEAAGLLLIGLAGLAALLFARPGAVFTWFLVAYAIMRFGLEGLRGDPRPHLLGLSQNRWMCLGELGLALWLSRSSAGLDRARELAIVALLALILALGLVLVRASDSRRRLLAGGHVRELRELVRAESSSSLSADDVDVRTTSRGVAVAVSRIGADGAGSLQASFSLPAGPGDIALLCEFAAGALPQLVPGSGQLTGETVLHVVAPAGASGEDSPASVAGALYGAVVRRLQAPDAEQAQLDGGYFERRARRGAGNGVVTTR